MTERFVPINKQSKKAQREANKKNRLLVGFNTGTRVMKTQKNPTRAMLKDADRKGREIYGF